MAWIRARKHVFLKGVESSFSDFSFSGNLCQFDEESQSTLPVGVVLHGVELV